MTLLGLVNLAFNQNPGNTLESTQTQERESKWSHKEKQLYAKHPLEVQQINCLHQSSSQSHVVTTFYRRGNQDKKCYSGSSLVSAEVEFIFQFSPHSLQDSYRSSAQQFHWTGLQEQNIGSILFNPLNLTHDQNLNSTSTLLLGLVFQKVSVNPTGLFFSTLLCVKSG